MDLTKFSREFEAIANKNDVIAISTSGNSRNILNLIQINIKGN